MSEEQLALFPPSNVEVILEVAVAKQQIANVRKGLFKRFGELNEEIVQLKEDIKLISSKLGLQDDTNKTSNVSNGS